jgi:hypothetical protein
MKKILLTLLLVVTPFIFSTVQAQEGHQQVIDRVFGSGGEVYFKFKVTDKSEADILTRTISIDNVKGHEVYALTQIRKSSPHSLTWGTITLSFSIRARCSTSRN